MHVFLPRDGRSQSTLSSPTQTFASRQLHVPMRKVGVSFLGMYTSCLQCITHAQANLNLLPATIANKPTMETSPAHWSFRARAAFIITLQTRETAVAGGMTMTDRTLAATLPRPLESGKPQVPLGSAAWPPMAPVNARRHVQDAYATRAATYWCRQAKPLLEWE